MAITLLLPDRLVAQGIPEPDLILYGLVKNVRSNANLRLGHGTLTWVFQPSGGGPPFTNITTLTNINEQFSYILRIPCETPVPGFPATSNTIQLTLAGLTFDRKQAVWNGTNALTFVTPTQTNTTFASTDRGRVERVDFNVDLPIVIDVNGLPVDWQLLYFGTTGVDPFADPDGDGMTTSAEYLAGTNPNDKASGLWITEIASLPGIGVRLKWTSALFKNYAVQRSSSPVTGFSDLVAGIAANAPTNDFLDLSAAPPGPWYYRIRLVSDSIPLGTPFRISSLQTDLLGGLRLQWSSEPSKVYAVQRSSNLSTGFADIQLNLGATPPVNSFRDSNATGFGPYFYRLRLQP